MSERTRKQKTKWVDLIGWLLLALMLLYAASALNRSIQEKRTLRSMGFESKAEMIEVADEARKATERDKRMKEMIRFANSEEARQ